MVRCITLLFVGVLVATAGCERPAGEDFTGKWLHQETGGTAELVLAHDKTTGRVTGTFAALGKQAAIEGRAEGASLVIDKVGDLASSPENGTMVGAVSGENMIFTISQPGSDAVILQLARQPGSAPTPTAATGNTERPQTLDDPDFTPSQPEAFAGEWQAVSEDGTYTETAEIEVSGKSVQGILRSLERGYFSGRTTVKAEVALRGTWNSGALDIRAWNTEGGSAENSVAGRAMKRGEYLIVRIGDGETGYARSGVPIVKSAEGSAAAAKLAESVAGRVYSASSSGSGRGAFVGNRVRLALCSDATIAFDVSDLASTGGADGVDMGDATSRRGRWSVVLLAGRPVVRAQWTGTGSSYSLTRYFRIEPKGSSAVIDGTELPVSGSC